MNCNIKISDIENKVKELLSVQSYSLNYRAYETLYALCRCYTYCKDRGIEYKIYELIYNYAKKLDIIKEVIV